LVESIDNPIFVLKKPTMSISFVKDKIQVDTRRDALKIHLMIKAYQKGVALSDADIDTLIELKEIGYNKEFFENCVRKGYFRSNQTVRNAVARMTSMGILTYKKRGERDVNTEFLPEVNSDKVIFQYMIGNP